MKEVEIKYFASLKDSAGKSSEVIQTSVEDISQLYQVIKEKYDFSLNEKFLKFALNDEFVEKNTIIKNGDVVVFIPPVAGG